MKQLLSFSGIEEDRLHSKWISSAEGPEFAEEMTEFVEKLREMGPSPLKLKAKGKKAA